MAVATSRAIRRARERDYEPGDRPTKKSGGDVVMVNGMDDMLKSNPNPPGAEREAGDEELEREVEQEIEIEPEDDEGARSSQARKRETSREREREVELENEDDDPEEEARLAYEETEEGLQERRGTSRRARRNRSRREFSQQRDQELQQLRQALDHQGRYLQSLTQGHIGITINNIDQQLTTARANMERISVEMARAVKEGDGEAFERVQRLRDETNSRIFQMESAKARIIADVQGQGGRTPAPQQHQQQQGQARQTMSPRALQLSEIFMERHPWFDPDGGDEDSRLASAIDDAIAAEGYNPATPMYWREFEKRLRARGIGYDRTDDEGGEDGFDEERDTRRSTQDRQDRQRRSALPPRNGARGHRTNGAPRVRLQPMMVEYLDSEGLLGANLSKEQVERKNRLIRAWKAGEERAKREGR